MQPKIARAYASKTSKIQTSNLLYVCIGAATVRIAMPTNMQSSLIFHYNLKFYDSDGDSYDGVSLKRFVMQVFKLPFFTVITLYNN